ncbi:MAG: Uma2 family endonuclease, partial [Ruminococcus sp.]|nr:Uma2 family endonuclease [Ruminococcus sp.]
KLYELIDGEIVALASPDIKHHDITTELFSRLREYIKANGGDCKPFHSPVDVCLDYYNCVQPDVFVVCDPSKIDDKRVTGAPDFIIEVVSSNRSDDYVRKLSLYKDKGVREYWIIDPKFERTLVYCFDKDDYPQVYTFSQHIPVGIYNGELEICVGE